jgi:hypothetical protein
MSSETVGVIVLVVVGALILVSAALRKREQ